MDPLAQKQAGRVKNGATTSKMVLLPQNGPSCLRTDPAVSKLGTTYGKWARCVEKGPTDLKVNPTWQKWTDHLKNGPTCSKWTQWPQKRLGGLTSGPNVLKMDPSHWGVGVSSGLNP
ncbi:hypothetical protein BDN67DRAFT_1018110 [Paxillus ammoniavirescens]|nr:hypothetical protein BDN67DRAFT_1018110 [Paxillus ammoniavirescens]